MLTNEQLEENRRRSKEAVENAKKILKPGDRLRVRKCPNTKRWMTFDHWDGPWMVSKSGINDYHPVTIDRVNDKEKEVVFYT